MFQLFKKRNFSELVGDTFTFFKMHGRHYYTNYFIINGGFLLILLVLSYFMMNIFVDGFTSNLNGAFASSGNGFETYINDNLSFVIGLGIFGAIAMLFLSILSFAYPVAYLKLQENGPNFTTSDILSEIKSKTGKILTFFIASIFILVPITFVVTALCFALVFLVIGIPLLFILIPAMLCWFSQSFYEYFSSDKGYFESLGTGFTFLKQKFWPSIGSAAVMYFVTQIAVGVFTMIPYMIGIFSMLTSLENQSHSTPDMSFFRIMMGIAMVLAMLMNFIFQNLLLVNQGIIYYSVREENENNISKNEIDLIGIQGE